MTAAQEIFVALLEDADLRPNLTMAENGIDWTEIQIELDEVTLTFDPDGKLVSVERDES